MSARGRQHLNFTLFLLLAGGIGCASSPAEETLLQSQGPNTGPATDDAGSAHRGGNDAADGKQAGCGDSVCAAEETTRNCPQDCPATGETCGDGKCSADEQGGDCPEDCAEQEEDCLTLYCAEPFAECNTSVTCDTVFACMQACEQDSACVAGCKRELPSEWLLPLQELVDCGLAAGCLEKTTVVATCGNDTCETGESKSNCPQDCGGTQTPLQCLSIECTEAIGDCFDNTGCAQLFACLDGCADDLCTDLCLDSAHETALTLLKAVTTCGTEKGCFEQAPPDDACGDGLCESNEDINSCPLDCDPELACLQSHCPQQLGLCIAIPSCIALKECVDTCAGKGNCVGQCFAQASPQATAALEKLLGCGADNQCDSTQTNPADCGDGVCSENEDPNTCASDCALSCAGHCGSKFSPGAACQCDVDCADFADCCDDYDDFCGTGTVFSCLIDSCDTGLCLSVSGCVDALQCLSNCANDACWADCTETAPAGAQGTLASILLCGQTTGCFGPIPAQECGDDTCDPGENTFTCPSDCSNAAGPSTTCIYEHCTAAVGACSLNFECMTGLQCLQACGGDKGCATACSAELGGSAKELLETVITCATNHACFDAQ